MAPELGLFGLLHRKMVYLRFKPKLLGLTFSNHQNLQEINFSASMIFCKATECDFYRLWRSQNFSRPRGLRLIANIGKFCTLSTVIF